MPDYYLSMKTKARKEDLVSQMPDVLDLLTVSVEAGLGFDAAIAKVCERMKGPLVEEFRIVLHEMRIGEARSKALKNFADRLDMNETTTFARSIIQADQLGISLARILRVQGQDMRHRRQMAAEERAMKAPDQDAVPDRRVHLPGHVRGHPRPGDALADEALHRLSSRSSSTRVCSSERSGS